MFRGRYEHTIDPKGRLSIPAKFREILKTQYHELLVVTNFQGCLVAYPEAEWRILEEKLSSMSMVKKEITSFQRFLLASATECPIDRQGRIFIPPILRDYAGLEKEVVVAGMLKKIEIWAKEKWEEEMERSRRLLEEDLDVLADLGL